MGTDVGVELGSGVGVFVGVSVTVFWGVGVAVEIGLTEEQETKRKVSTIRVICFRPTIFFPSQDQCQTLT